MIAERRRATSVARAATQRRCQGERQAGTHGVGVGGRGSNKGDDACDGGIFAGTYAVLGGVDRILPVDMKIPGNPPTPARILEGLLALMKKAAKK